MTAITLEGTCIFHEPHGYYLAAVWQFGADEFSPIIFGDSSAQPIVLPPVTTLDDAYSA